jgi:hypothetical protein
MAHQHEVLKRFVTGRIVIHMDHVFFGCWVSFSNLAAAGRGGHTHPGPPKIFMNAGTRKFILAGAILLLVVINTRAETLTVPAGGNVQAAINAANPGDTIIVLAGVTYNANLTLPNKAGSAPITIQSSRISELPTGARVTPAQSPLLAKFVSVVPAEPVMKTATGAHDYVFVGISVMTANEDLTVYDLIRLGDGRQTQKTLDSVPHHITIDRSYIHGWPTQDVQRGVSMQCAECSVTNSYISDIHMVGIEAQGIAGWNGPGPFHIINNYIEASTQGILFGGADPASAELAPANAEIRQNLLFKPLSWKVGDPSYAGKHWTVKNILEFKSMKGAIVDGNIFRNNWTDGQDGKAILFTVRNQECSAPWSTIQNVIFTNNIIENAEGGLNFLGKDNEADASFGKCPASTGGSTRGSDVLIANSLFRDIRGPFLTINGFYNVTLDHDTHVQQGNLMTLYGEASNGLKYTNNLTIDHDYGIFGDGGTSGVAALNKYAPGWVATGNTIAKPYDKSAYPVGNTYPDSITIPSDWRSPVIGVGADIDALNAAQSGSVVTTPTPSPTPTATPTATPTPTPLATPTPTPAPSPSPVPTPTPARIVYEVTYPTASSDTDRQRVTRDLAGQGWVCIPNPGGKFLICHRVKM